MSDSFQRQEPQLLNWPSQLHLLIVEDVPEDLELIVLVLETSGANLTYDCVETLPLCRQKLKENIYDAVLSDYRLPHCNGLQTFDLLQQSEQEIPFILVTGSLGEEAAVECIKAGMTDYVLKDRLFRLPTVLGRSLQEFELRRQQKAARTQIQSSAWRETIINRIVQTMRETLILEEILQTTADQLEDAFQASSCLIFQPDAHQQMRVNYVSKTTTEGKSLVGISCNFYRYYQENLAKGEQVVFSEFNCDLAPELQETVQGYGISSLIITPLLYRESYLGGINLYQRDRQRQWTDNELALVKAVAAQCAIAINQAQLYQQAQTELTERQRAEAALRQSEQRFRALIENATDIVTILDQEQIFRYVSPSAQRILGFMPQELIGQQILTFIHPDDRAILAETLHQTTNHPRVSPPKVEYRFRSDQGNWHILEAFATNLLDDPAVQGIVMNCHEITERKSAEEQLRHDALHDALTGLPNRALLMDRLEQALKRSQRRKDRKFAVLFLDLDRFKTINDSLGHLVGDQLLIALTHRLQTYRRESDTVARLGGDEFVILLEEIEDVNDAIEVAERIHRSLSPPFILEGREVFTSVSMGIALSSSNYSQPEQLLRDADTAMYYAKAHGKARHEVFAPSMHAQALKQLHIESDLWRSIERQELLVYYQPIISLTNNSLKGVEALVRWQHPEQGLIPPDEFIPIAEETGLIVALDRWVLQEACQQLSLWQEQFPSVTPLTLSVNFSGKHFAKPDLTEEIDLILDQTSLKGEYLKLEITESVLIQNPESVAEIFQLLRERKIEVCLDDFGTGYSSLSYLHRFPLSILKIDRSFVSNLEIQDSNAAIVRTILAMADELGIGVVAEGIETTSQMLFLKNLGCQWGQGYWFSRPVDSETMTALIASKYGMAV
ncbi:EAL domain-containing protein [Merismopedia glauca]|uniref:Two-component system response regulator n=1 Tax=Merismopedia glauca CCAP 1448/3 TaxID=1296344 RepID=A0A2T1C6J4_9CYAN|nr:EAL domain-containing protein [Merismopedia glauca]PSB03900.1 two-component system response regulator [Merismopedia glauca CCAP 1448/3]